MGDSCDSANTSFMSLYPAASWVMIEPFPASMAQLANTNNPSCSLCFVPYWNPKLSMARSTLFPCRNFLVNADINSRK